jgi:AraC-like DNA-binding protein
MRIRHGEIEIGIAIAVPVALQMAARKAELTGHVVEGLAMDEVKGLIAALKTIGVETAQIDQVMLRMMKIADHVVAGDADQCDVEDKVIRALTLVTNVQDFMARPIVGRSTSALHLRRYVEFLLASNEIRDDPMLIKQLDAFLLDLVVLALGIEGDMAQIATMRGLRAARAREIVAEINASFADPGFSSSDLARKLGLSTRYIQDLLQETGWSLGERVLELRLQKARTMLADRRHDRLKVSDIALACGFNGIAYFNQCFRRRFGASPMQFRGGRSV